MAVRARSVCVLLAVLSLTLTQDAIASRFQYSLQRFDIKTLSVLTVVQVTDAFNYGIVIDPDRYVQTVVVGDYMGKHNGKITSITADGINVEEIYSSNSNAWVTKNIFLRKADQ